LATIAAGSGSPGPFYASGGTVQPLTSSSVALAGGSQFHTNLQPYLTINWCICMFGIFPSRN